MKQLVYLPIPSEQFYAHESDVKECSELYDMKGVTQIFKICEVIDDEVDYQHPLYAVQRNGDDYYYLFLDRSEFQLASIQQVFTFCSIWIEEESLEGLSQYLNK